MVNLQKSVSKTAEHPNGESIHSRDEQNVHVPQHQYEIESKILRIAPAYGFLAKDKSQQLKNTKGPWFCWFRRPNFMIKLQQRLATVANSKPHDFFIGFGLQIDTSGSALEIM